MGIFDTQPLPGGFPGPMPAGTTPQPAAAPAPGAGPCLHGSHQGPNGNMICNPDPGAGGAGQFGTTFKPWESIDTTVSQAQWKAWEGMRDPGCPPNKPYKSERGAPGCFEKPVDCPDGQMPGGPGNSPCVPNPKGGGAASGGAGLSGGGGSTGFNQWDASVPFEQWVKGYAQSQAARTGDQSWLGTLSPRQMEQARSYYSKAQSQGGGMPGGDLNSQMALEIQKLFGEDSRFSPQVMDDITSKNKLTEQNRIAQDTNNLRESQAARGIINSPFAAAQEARSQAAAGAAFDAGQRDLRVQKAATDFQDKLSALGAAQQWLNSLRTYALGMDSNNVQREGIMANLTLGREKIKAEMSQLLTSLSSQKDLLGMTIDSNESIQYQKMIQCIQTGVC